MRECRDEPGLEIELLGEYPQVVHHYDLDRVRLYFFRSWSAHAAHPPLPRPAWLPRPKLPITGPNGIQASFSWQASEHPTLGKTCTVTLVNDVSAY